MTVGSRGLVVVLGLVLGGWFNFASGQQAPGESQERSTDSKKAPRVSLGDASGAPGDSIVVPIYFTPGAGVEVGELKLEVKFVSRNLKYSRFSTGPAAELGNVDVRHEIKEEKNEDGLEISTLTVLASVPESAEREKGIPGGLIAYVTLRVNEGAGPANIALRATAEAGELKTKNRVQDLEVMSDRVDILAPGSEPLVSCFFFSH
jgi:hypothetical protein